MQRVLVVEQIRLQKILDGEGFFEEPADVHGLLDIVRRHGEFVDRGEAEEDHAWKQIVACAVIHTKSHILCLRRARNSNRASLRLRHTVLLGGHADDFDRNSSDMLESCMRRELHEELGLKLDSPPRLLGVVSEPYTQVGSLHIGFVYDVEIRENVIQLSRECDTAEFTMSGRPRTVELLPFHQIRPLSPSLDPWSKLFIASHCFACLSPNPIHYGHDRQLEIPFADLPARGVC